MIIEINLLFNLGWSCKHMDEFIDSLLVEELVCDIALPHLPKRIKLEQLGILDERTSILDADLLNAEEDAVIAAYNLKIASQEKNVNDGKLSAPDATPVLKPSDKKKPLDEPSPGNEEYISEYRRDDVRSRKAAAVCNDDDSRKDVEERGEKIREHSADRGRSRRDSGGEKYGPGVNSGRGDQRDNGRDRDKRYIPLRRSGSRDKARRRERDRKSENDHSRSRSRTRDRRRDRDDRGSDRYVSHRDSDSRRRESDHNRKGRDRARSRSYDSRSRSPINKHKKESRKSSSKEYDYDKRERRRDRERSLSSKKRGKQSSRRSGGSRHRAASCDSEDVRGKSRRHPRSPSLSRSRSRSPSRSSSSSQSESDRERRRKRISSSAAKKSEDDISESAEDSAQVEVSLAEEKAAAMKASKAEKIFDKMFKTKKTNTEGDSQGSSSVAVKAHPEGSVEYWNQIREGLGIKKLKS